MPGIPQVSTRFSLSMEMTRLTRDGTAEPVSRDQILRHAWGQGNIHFPCSADHEQDWQPYQVDPYSAICDDHTYILYVYTPLIVIFTPEYISLFILLYGSSSIPPALIFSGPFSPGKIFRRLDFNDTKERLLVFKEKTERALDLLSIPQSGGKNVKTV